jgi:recombination protein RecT
MVLPANVTAEYFIQVSLTAIYTNPKLLECSKNSILGSVMKAAQLQLSLDPLLGHAYLVPRYNKKTRGLEAALQIGYRGYIELAQRSGKVSYVYSELVYACDFLHIEFGAEKVLRHVPNFEDETRGDVDEFSGELLGLKGAYTVTKYSDGATDFEYMPIKELNRIKGRSLSLDSGPWVTDPQEMFKKIPTRRMAKRWPLSPQAVTAAIHEESLESGGGRSPELDTVVMMPPLPAAAPSEEKPKEEKPKEEKPKKEPPAPPKEEAPPPPKRTQNNDEPNKFYEASGILNATSDGRTGQGTKFRLLKLDVGYEEMEIYNFEPELMDACKTAVGHGMAIKYHKSEKKSGDVILILDDVLGIDGVDYRNGVPMPKKEPDSR